MGIGGGIGLVDVGKDTVVGLYDTVTDPKGTAESLYHSVTNPVETYKYIEKSIADSYERDMINGDAESRSHWVTYALGTTATAVVGTKGAGALTKTGVATTKTAVQKSVTTVPNTMQSSRLAQFLPYAPRTQVALPGGVPFGVINGPVLKESLNMQAKKLPDSGAGLKGTVKSTVNPLLPTEGKVGTFKELAKQGTAFDNITPHHMPSAEKMKQVGVKRNNGVSLNMEQPHPGAGGRHRETYTYGLNGKKLEEYLNLSFRDALAHDILDARGIYKKDGVYTPEIRDGLRNVIKNNNDLYPDLFKK